jgi:uncharacterized SAM-binding protein YcdF (DUF218 family)
MGPWPTSSSQPPSCPRPEEGPGRRRRGGERPPRLSAELVEWGVPRTAILVDARSRTTRENAVETERILTARGARSLLLVTSALHMPRGGLVYYRLRGWTR